LTRAYRPVGLSPKRPCTEGPIQLIRLAVNTEWLQQSSLKSNEDGVHLSEICRWVRVVY